MTSKKRRWCGALVVAAFASSAWAAPLTLNFDGIASGASIDGFYASQGAQFSANALALNQNDERANFSRAPSPDTVMFFREGSAVLNFAAGFDTGLSFWYSTTSDTAFVDLWSEENAQGTRLGRVDLAALGSGDDADDPYSIWSLASFAFAGVARSIDFGGTANRVGFDDVTLGAIATASPPVVDPDLRPTPTIESQVPEAPTLALALAALGALGATRRRKR